MEFDAIRVTHAEIVSAKVHPLVSPITIMGRGDREMLRIRTVAVKTTLIQFMYEWEIWSGTFLGCSVLQEIT